MDSRSEFGAARFVAASKDGLMRFLWRLVDREDSLETAWKLFKALGEIERLKTEIECLEESKAWRDNSINELYRKEDKYLRTIQHLRTRLSEMGRDWAMARRPRLP